MKTRLLIIILAVAALPATSASAAPRAQILRDCALDGKLDGQYSAGELRDARKHLPADSDEYSDCRDLLREAELRAVGGGGGAAGDGGSADAGSAMPASGARSQLLTPGNPAEAAAVADAKSGAAKRGVSVGGRTVVPGATGLGTGAAASSLPPAVIGVLILLGAASLALALPAVRKHARIPVFRRR